MSHQAKVHTMVMNTIQKAMTLQGPQPVRLTDLLAMLRKEIWTRGEIEWSLG